MFALLVGHLLGDYVFQNSWMAKNKSAKSWLGLFACIVHCLIYSCLISAMVYFGGWRFDGPTVLVAFIAAFVTHFPIDRDSLGKYWMKFFGQDTEGPFAPIVYVGVDNGIHLALMFIFFSRCGVWR